VQHVSGLHGRDVGRPGDGFGDAVREVAGVVVGAQLAADPQLHVQVLRVSDLVLCGDAGAERREAVVRLAAGYRHLRTVDAATAAGRGHARRNVDAAGVAEYVVHSLRFG